MPNAHFAEAQSGLARYRREYLPQPRSPCPLMALDLQNKLAWLRVWVS